MGFLKYIVKVANTLPNWVDWIIIEKRWPSAIPYTSRIKLMVDNFSFDIKKDKTLILSIKLKGEATPVSAEINIKNLLSNQYLKFSEIHFSREWLNLLIKNFAPEIINTLGLENKGEQILIPKEYVDILRKIVD